MAEVTPARKVADLHNWMIIMAGGFEPMLGHLFGDAAIDEVSDEVKMAGRDGEVIVLCISARRLPADEAAALIAARGAIGS